MNRVRVVAATLLTTAVWSAVASADTTRPVVDPSILPSTNHAATAPTTARATTGPATQAVVSPAAAVLLKKLAVVYARPRPWHGIGHVVGTFDVAGRSKTYTLAIDGLTDGGGNFRHDAGPAGLIVNDGHDSYLYDAKRDSFAELTAVFGRRAASDTSEVLTRVLLDENPALLMTLVDDADALLRRVAKRIDVASETTQPITRPSTPPAETTAATADAVVLDLGTKRITLRLNPAGEIVASALDYRPLFESRKTNAVKSADVVLTYDAVTHEVPSPDAFTWRPPSSATQFDAGEELMRE